jgi:hypothetical protein
MNVDMRSSVPRRGDEIPNGRDSGLVSTNTVPLSQQQCLIQHIRGF